MRLKLIKRKQKTWLNTFNKYITNFEILKESKIFTWSFMKYFIQVTILNNYDVIRLPVEKVLIGLMFIKKYKSENYIDIHAIYIREDINKKIRKGIFSEIDILQKVKMSLEAYRALGYFYVEATFPYYKESELNFLLNKIGFKENLEKNLTNLVNNKNKDFITLLKPLQNE